MPHVNADGGGGDDFASTDEVKVYKDEGDEEQRSSENLSEDKIGLVIETEERKSSDLDIQNNYSTDENSTGANIGAKLLEYPIPERLPFGYPLIPPYPFSNVSSAGKLFPTHPTLGFYMYPNDSPMSQPPPAHMGIPSLQIDPKTGLPRHSVYGIPASPGHLPHPLYPPDLSQLHSFDMLARSSSAGPFCGSYPPTLTGSPLAWFGPSGILPPHPGFPYPGLNHPAIVTPGIKQEISPLSESSENCRDCHPLPTRCKLNGVTGSHGHGGGGAGGGCIGVDLPQDKKRPYIKKPLNAYMLFMKEMRQKVIEECTLKESAAINQILGRKWHALDRAEQQKYYDMARKEKELHLQLYPGWSARDNYATHTKKRKRKRDAVTEVKSLSKDAEDTPTDCPNNRNCRAMLGSDHQTQWCKSCRSDFKFITESNHTSREDSPVLRCLPSRFNSQSETDSL